MKQSKHKLTRFAMAVLMVAAMLVTVLPMTAFAYESYGLYVADVYVTSDNYTNITSSKITGQVSYDPTTHTLTLNNATIKYNREVNITTCIYNSSRKPLNIRLIGENELNCVLDEGGEVSLVHTGIYAGNSSITFTGNGSLSIKTGNADTSIYGMVADSVTFDRECTVDFAIMNPTGRWPKPINYYNSLSYAGLSATSSTSATGTPAVPFDPDQMVDYRYLKFEPAANVTVSFDGNGATGTMTDASVLINSEYTLPACGFTAPAGQQFKVWEVNGEEMAVGDKIFVSSNVTVTAIWEVIPHTCDIQPVAKAEPNCTEGGKEAYYKCDGCGKFFEDEQGATEIEDIDTWGNLDKLGHKDANADGKCDRCSQQMVPKTGDTARPMLWAMLVLISGAGLALVLKKKATQK